MDFKDYQKATRATATYHDPFKKLNHFFEVMDIGMTWYAYWDDPEKIELKPLMEFYRKKSVFGYLCTALTGELGEFENMMKKYLRGDSSYANLDGSIPENVQEIMKRELGDVLWYISELCTELGLSLEDVAETNIQKLAERKAQGTIKDNGQRNE